MTDCKLMPSKKYLHVFPENKTSFIDTYARLNKIRKLTVIYCITQPTEFRQFSSYCSFSKRKKKNSSPGSSPTSLMAFSLLGVLSGWFFSLLSGFDIFVSTDPFPWKRGLVVLMLPHDQIHATQLLQECTEVRWSSPPGISSGHVPWFWHMLVMLILVSR